MNMVLMKIKKIFSLLLLLSLVIILSGCKSDEKQNKDELLFYLDKSFTKYMPYKEVPRFSIPIEKEVYSNVHEKSFTKLLQKNDDFYISHLIASLIDEYQSKNRVIIKSVQKNKTLYARINEKKDGKIIPQSLKTDDDYTYYEVAYFSLENGLKFTIDYRKFFSGGKTYYVWRETSGLNMCLYYPFYITKIAGEVKILLITLPNYVSFQVSPLLRVKRLINNSAYLSKEKYTFFLKDEMTKNDVISYYLDFSYNDTEKTFIYLDYKFKLSFGETKKDKYFQISFVGKK